MNGEWLDLSGRVCVVTGAGGGLGRAIAISLNALGCRLVLLDRDPATCEKPRAELAARPSG